MLSAPSKAAVALGALPAPCSGAGWLQAAVARARQETKANGKNRRSDVIACP
jgi:hypothetical protein